MAVVVAGAAAMGGSVALAQGGGAGGATLVLPPAPAGVQVTREFGHEFVTIGAVGNPAFGGPVDANPFVIGRGGVSYEYRMSRLELSSGQWVDFMNVAGQVGSPVANRINQFVPNWWTGRRDPAHTGPGSRFTLTNTAAANYPVIAISWEAAALYCNWLHNGKSNDPLTLTTGAYDSTTWGPGVPGVGFPHGPRLPGARFWIPSHDEWIKAVHYDPNRLGPGQGGYWKFASSSDQPPIFGPPGVGTSSAGMGPLFNHVLGSYGVQTPWGLLDADGMGEEWTDSWLGSFPTRLIIEGGGLENLGRNPDATPPILDADIEWFSNSGPPLSGFSTSFRIAALVPSPGAGSLVFLIPFVCRRNRQERLCLR